MEFSCGIDERPRPGLLLVFGLQWLAVSIPAILIVGRVVAGLQAEGAAIPYLQRLFLLIAVLLVVQVYLGHRLPLVLGPATVLLVGILASLDAGSAAINTSLLIGGLLLSAIALTGFVGHLKRLFTPRVIVVVLMLIAFTLAPVILGLVTEGGNGVTATATFLFAAGFALVLFAAHGLLGGFWRSTLAVWALIFGTAAYIALFGSVSPLTVDTALFALPGDLVAPLAVPDPGVLVAFLICYLALATNDLGSIQSVGSLLAADGMDDRINRGVGVTGLGNVIAGLTGVIGPVNFSLSPGVIAATGCASRFALVPAAVGLGLMALSPRAIGYMECIPGPVIGVVLAYVMATQIAAGLVFGQESGALETFDGGLIIGIPLLLGTLVAFLPAEVVTGLPAVLRPVLANGFVVGIVTVLGLEHIVYRRRSEGEG
ncbi:solute carrier family 23 protein [Methanoculleus sp.]|uniref:uracil-xanthine permease family protein n=1 Tax=Methanoculleus sp. TaxID=90427 RepID=UPI002609C811|nr:solute carrier family 23 protein [Methanoculleus sp.]MDI6866615.1 solute carrier family 23 protein [Methanoculleus sp.]